MLPILLFLTSVSFSSTDGLTPWYWAPHNKPIIKPSNNTRVTRSTVVAENTEAAASTRFIVRVAPTNNNYLASQLEKRYDPVWYEEWVNRTTERPPQQVHHPDHNTGHHDNVNCPRDVIHDRYHGRGYFFSWKDRRSQDLRMTWVQAVNFCRARCMEAVSVESIEEHQFLARHIFTGNIRGAWTSGRKCDFSGCEKESHMQPVNVYGWFWEGIRTQLPPTTDRFDTRWSQTGSIGKPQPDNANGQSGGENESCLALLNNVFNDGVSWHDEVCSKRKRIICEEKPRHGYEDRY